MTIRQFVSMLVVAAMLAACGAQDASSNGAVGALRALLQTDKDFSAMSAKDGARAAFTHYLADDAVSLPQGGAPMHGADAISAQLPGPDGGTLTWTPSGGDVAASGDLGYTWGSYEYRGKNAKGEAVVGYGKYTTVWKRQASGEWRAVLDMGNQSPGPASGSEPEVAN